MTREQATENLKSLGIAEPTKEQIDSYLNSFSGDIKREKDLAEKYKADSLRVSELEKALEELNNKGLDEVALIKKELEKSASREASLTKELAKMKLTAELAGIGISGDDAENLFNADGTLNVANLGTIISTRETTAKSALEKELLDKTPAPKGGNDGGDKNGTDEFVKSIVKQTVGNGTNSQSIVDNYK